MSALHQQHLLRRRKLAESFIAYPHLFKACDCCQSMSAVMERICRLCGAYRWRTVAAEVVAIAEVIGNSPFPFTAGVVPRLKP